MINTTNNNTTNNNAVETKTGKKIDESKPWVYDAEYLKDKEEKVKTNKENSLTFKSTEQIKLPYININSEDARIANDEIKVFEEKAYENVIKGIKSLSKVKMKSNSAFKDTMELTYEIDIKAKDENMKQKLVEAFKKVPGMINVSLISYQNDFGD